MFQDLGKRFLIAVGMLSMGMNLIAFLMKENGSANKYNPVWQLLVGFLDLEYLICKGIGIVILGVIALFCIVGVIEFVNQFSSEKKESYSLINLPEGKTKYRQVHSEKPKTTSIEINSPITPSINADPKPNLQPKIYAPTPEELKKKAIKQIMGKN